MDVEESHTSLPALVYFRSPQPERSWITAAGCVLDTAALVDSTLDRPRDGARPDHDAHRLLRAAPHRRLLRHRPPTDSARTTRSPSLAASTTSCASSCSPPAFR